MIDESNRIVFFEEPVYQQKVIFRIFEVQQEFIIRNISIHRNRWSVIAFLMKYPEAFYEFYKEKMMILDAKPNAAHLKLAELEQAGKLQAVVTQNIDGLHQAAGSRNVYELHGSIHRNYCMKCGKFYDAEYVKNSEGIPRCSCGGMIKPDVVLYEEGLDQKTIQGAVEAISSADMLIIGGTSLVGLSGSRFY